MNTKEYRAIAKKHYPSTKSGKNIPSAFISGGLICVLGQGLSELYSGIFLKSGLSSAMTSITLVFIGVALTAFGIYDKLAKRCGAGTLVPITGFANSVASPAIEFKSEGFILGTCVKMFTIAGPVLAVGCLSSVIYGAIIFFLGGSL